MLPPAAAIFSWAAAEKAGRSIAPYLTRLNRIRAEHPEYLA